MCFPGCDIIRWSRLRPWTGWFVGWSNVLFCLVIDCWGISWSRQFSGRMQHSSHGLTNHHVSGLSLDHQICLYFSVTIKLQTKSTRAVLDAQQCTVLAVIAEYCWWGQFNKQDVVIDFSKTSVGTWILCFLFSLINSCSVEWVGLTILIDFTAFSCAFSASVSVPDCLALTVVKEILICIV